MVDWTWTSSQQAAIHSVGASTLVSAAAGSGKTAVLAERCAHLVADVRPPCSVDRLLVVTFTEAAASEMRQRIAETLRGRLRESATNVWLRQQLALLDSAPISTIHAFCRRTLQRYFAQADLDPFAPVLDAHDAALLRLETARGVFDRFAQRRDAAGEAFLDFLAAYGPTDEQSVIQRVLAVDAFLASVSEPEAWIRSALDRFALATDAGLSDFWYDALVASLRAELREQLRVVQGCLAAWRRQSSVLAGSIACLEDYSRALEDWAGRLDRGGDPAALDEICTEGIGAYHFPQAPRRTKQVQALREDQQQAFSAAAQQVREIQSGLFKKQLKETYGRYTTADWAEGIARTRPHLATFITLVQALRQAYQAAKRDLGVVDFSDLERKTLDLLRNEETGVAARLRDRFDHVLVDEFQDVNPVQAEILRLVSRESDPHRAGNLFVVGDVKQSIYRFRLAEPQLFLSRRDAFAQGRGNEPHRAAGVAIDLVENFRSRRGVIDAINAVFERLMAPDLGGIRYDQRARLKPGRTDAMAADGPALELHILDEAAGPVEHPESDDSPPEAFEWERIEREAYVIAQCIRDLVRQGTAYQDIAILLRSMAPRAALLVRTLSRLNVPVWAEVSGGFFDALEVQDVLALLALLDNQQQDIPWAAVLRSPLLGRPLTDSQLVQIRTAAAVEPSQVPRSTGLCSAEHRPGAGATDVETDADGATALTFHDAVRHYAQHGSDGALRARLSDILRRLHAWRQRIGRRPLADVLWEIYEESGYLAYVSGLREGRQRRANLLRLHEYARQFASFTRQGLYRFLRFLDALREADQDLETAPACDAPENVVRLMTIHRAKGLEFPVVIVGEVGKRFNLSDTRGSILFDRRLGVALEAVDVERRITYPTLPHRLVSQAARLETLAEEMRILYVALTRARERLILVGTARPGFVERAREQYAGHVGPLPLLIRQGAQSMLDWILPAICCQPSRDVCFNGEFETPTDAPPFVVRTHRAEHMRQWVIEPPQRSGVSARLKRCARLEPIRGASPPAGPADSEPIPKLWHQRRAGVSSQAGGLCHKKFWDRPSVVETIRRRLTTPYPARVLTEVPAVVAASVLKRRWDVRQDDEQPAPAWAATSATAPTPMAVPYQFREPTCLKADRPADQAARGTWTHEVLQRLDLRRPCDRADLRAQVKSLINAGALRETEAGQIDLDGLKWFFTTSLAARLRAPGARVLREWPFVLGVDPRRYDPSAPVWTRQDLMLVRGIVDCLFDAGDGWEIVDYKTDAVSGTQIARRAQEYRGQLQIYADAVQTIWRREVAHRWLVFLTPRKIVEV